MTHFPVLFGFFWGFFFTGRRDLHNNEFEGCCGKEL